MQEIIKGFKETMTEGIEKIACDIPAEQHEDFIEKCAEELERLVLVTGMDKSAGFLGGFGGAVRNQMTGTMGGGLMGTGAVALGGTLAANAITGLASMAVDKVRGSYGASSNRTAYEKSLRDALARSEILREADQAKVKRMADSIFSFAPTVASDSNVLTNILMNSIHGDSIDLQTVRAVTELEEKLNKMKN